MRLHSISALSSLVCILLITACSEDDPQAPTTPPDNETAMTRWQTQAVRLTPDPDLYAVYFAANHWREPMLQCGGDQSVVMASEDGLDWTMYASYGNGGRTVAFASTSQASVGITDGDLAGEVLIGGGGLSDFFFDSNAQLRSVATDGIHFVAVGDRGTVVVTTDVEQFDEFTLGAGDFDLTDVAWGGTAFFACASDGVIRRSTDGYAWSVVGPASATALRALAIGGSVIVAIDQQGQLSVRRSSAGPAYTVGRTSGFNDVAWSGTMFVAVGDDGRIATSSSGQIWSRRPSGTGATLRAVVATPKFVAVGDAGTIWVSDDVQTWRVRQPARRLDFGDLEWVGDTFVATEHYHGILLSPDGIQWSIPAPLQANPLNLHPYALASSGDVTIAVSGAGLGEPQHVAVLRSSDLQNWPRVYDNYSSVYPIAACWTGSEFLVLAEGGVLLRSPDGQQWQESSYHASGSPRAITTVDNTLLAVDSYGYLFTSTNGTNWGRTGVVYGRTPRQDITWTGEEYVVVGIGEIWVSKDRKSWVEHDPDTKLDLSGVAASPDRFVAAGRDGVVRTLER